MIPNNTWSNSYFIVEQYPNYGIIPTDLPRVHAVSIGPEILNASNGRLIDRYWMVTQNVNGQVTIAGAT